MSKLSALFTIALLFAFMLTYANARTEPTLPKTQMQEVENEIEESCQGVRKEECLERRTLAAHVDYIYTQQHKP